MILNSEQNLNTSFIYKHYYTTDRPRLSVSKRLLIRIFTFVQLFDIWMYMQVFIEENDRVKDRPNFTACKEMLTGNHKIL